MPVIPLPEHFRYADDTSSLTMRIEFRLRWRFLAFSSSFKSTFLLLTCPRLVITSSCLCQSFQTTIFFFPFSYLLPFVLGCRFGLSWLLFSLHFFGNQKRGFGFYPSLFSFPCNCTSTCAFATGAACALACFQLTQLVLLLNLNSLSSSVIIVGFMQSSSLLLLPFPQTFPGRLFMWLQTPRPSQVLTLLFSLLLLLLCI